MSIAIINPGTRSFYFVFILTYVQKTSDITNGVNMVFHETVSFVSWMGKIR